MTRLTKTQKTERKEMKAGNPNVQLFSFDNGVTVGVERTGNTMARFAVSIASEDEAQFRRKVGEFNVLTRFDYGYTLPMRLDSDMQDAESVAFDIAVSIGG